MAVKLGYKKIVVAPYFLFGGKLIDRIYAYVDKVAADNPDIEFMKANYLRDQAHVINTFVQRIEETIEQPNPAAGLMHSFQQRLAKGEVDIHHHHAEYQPEGHAHSSADDHGHTHAAADQSQHAHQHGHSNGHSHGHSHAPYKHIGHPNGPRTMINENLCCCFMGQFPQHIIDEETALRAPVDQVPSCKR
jgi:sirohydrochlorin cobaltochelatase